MRQPLQLFVVAAAIAFGCSKGAGPPTPTHERARDAKVDDSTERNVTNSGIGTDRKAILDAVIRHALTDPELKDSREFYGTPGDKRFALVSNSTGPSWPESYRPTVNGYEVLRVVEGTNIDRAGPRLLGIRLDKFNLVEKPSLLLDGQIHIVILNAGGDGGEATVIGGCTVYYDAKRDGDKWSVEFNGVLDP